MSDAFSATQTATIPHIIDGQKVLSDGRVGNVYNPATGQVTGQVNFADSELISQAVDAAEAALPGWRSTGMAKRAAVMFRLQQIISSRKDELAALITAEHGKVLSDAAGEITRGLENVEFCAGVVHHIDRKSTRLNSSHGSVSYAVFCSIKNK